MDERREASDPVRVGRTMRRRFAVLGCACAASGCASSRASPPSGTADGGVDVQLLSLATWLGQLDPVEGATGDGGMTPGYGGLPVLSSCFAADRAGNPNTALLLSGDSFGASPPLASQFDDVPAIKALELLSAEVDMLSNHNFDHGIPYLQTLIGLSSYPYVSSNMKDVQAQVSPRLAVPFVLLAVGPVKIGVLGVTDPDAPNKTLPGNFGGITMEEPASSANVAASQARAAGAQAVVALTDLQTTGIGAAGAHTGPLIDFARALVGVDVVLGSIVSDPGTPQVGGVLVVEHVWKGQTYGRTRLHFDRGVLTSAAADVVVPDPSVVAPDPNAVALLAPYRAQLDQLFDAPVSVAEESLPLEETERLQETAIGDFVADAFLAKYEPLGAQIAIVNGADVRDALPSSYAPSNTSLRRTMAGYAPGPPYDLVVGDPYSVLPFGNFCVLRAVTGTVLWEALEQSVFQEPSPNNGFLQIAGFKFSYQLSAPAGARVQSVTLDDGTVIPRDDATTYLLVDTNYLDSGGDDYGMLVQTSPAPLRDVDADVLLAYLRANPMVAPPAGGRITPPPRLASGRRSSSVLPPARQRGASERIWTWTIRDRRAPMFEMSNVVLAPTGIPPWHFRDQPFPAH